VTFTSEMESPENFRRWVAIGILAATLEQKCWCESGHGVIYPNLYIWLIAPPSAGKSLPIKEARKFLLELPDREKHIVPTSVTAASLSDAVAAAERIISFADNRRPVQYNSAILLPDELSAFMSDYDKNMIGLLTTMYDGDIAYGEDRRTTGLKLRIKRPQINMIVGCTPSNLMEYVPKHAWDQGFTSRLILVHGEKRKDPRDPFSSTVSKDTTDLNADLLQINELFGKFKVEDPFREKLLKWRNDGYPPIPNHPRLEHYNGRRWAHLLKLCMVSSVDRSDMLNITVQDFEQASSWLLTAEQSMPMIFEQGAYHNDSAAQNELIHFINNYPGPIPERALVHQARKLMPVTIITRTLEIFEKSGIIYKLRQDPRTGTSIYGHDQNQ
jgi:hypothetical protein